MMTGQPGQQQKGKAPPQYSPDGRWWWDGHQWTPVQQATAQPLSQMPVEPSQRIRPGRWLYLVAAVVFAAGALPLGFLTVSLISALSANTIHVIAPGKADITFAESGTYTINYEYQTTLDSRTFNTPPEFPSMELALVSTAFGTRVPIRAASASATYEVGSTKGAAIAEFTIDRPGTYTLASQYPGGETGPEVALAIGRGSPGAIIFAIFGILGASGLLLVGLAIGLAALILRHIAVGRARSARMLAEHLKGVGSTNSG